MYGLNDEIQTKLRYILDHDQIMESFVDQFEQDNSLYVYVDGEEGDYGIITYHRNGVPFVYCFMYGGGREEYLLTPDGKTVLVAAITANVHDAFSGRHIVDYTNKDEMVKDFTNRR